MKRVAYVVSWIAFVLYSIFAVLAFVVRQPATGYLLIIAAVLGLTLVAFHVKRSLPFRVAVGALNGVVALLAVVLVATGINFSAGPGALLTAGAALVLFFVPAALNAAALLAPFSLSSGA
jgi:hypothetical protein